MTQRLLLVATAAAVLAFSAPAAAALVKQCPPTRTVNDSWAWEEPDAFGQTVYRIDAPCKVLFGVQFNVVLTVRDPVFPEDLVGGDWSLVDTGLPAGPVTVLRSGATIWMNGGAWQVTVPVTYNVGAPIDHRVEFSYRDLGQGGGAHSWASGVAGDIVVDPYPNAAPTVDAGPDVSVASADAGALGLPGAASDPDGDAMTYRWLAGATELQVSRAVDASGAAPLDAGALVALPVGRHVLTLEVADAEHLASDTVTLTIEDTAPVVATFAGGTFQYGEVVLLEGSVADFDGGALAYRWLEGARLLAEGTVAAAAGGAPVPLPTQPLVALPVGAHELTLAVTDGLHEASATALVTVIDTLAPTLAPVASPPVLWPPNGHLVPVTVAANAHDAGGRAVSLTVEVTSDRDLAARAGGSRPDFEVLGIDDARGEIALALRAELNAGRHDRTYTITVTATDAAGNASSAAVPVVVSRRRAGSAEPAEEPSSDGGRASGEVRRREGADARPGR